MSRLYYGFEDWCCGWAVCVDMDMARGRGEGTGKQKDKLYM
jgi:hypothetical protein